MGALTDLLLGDIGGTGSRLLRLVNGKPDGEPLIVLNENYASFDAVLDDFLADTKARPDQLALAVAGPIHDNQVTMTNLNWFLSARDLAKAHSIQRVDIVNDFEALAWATLRLDESELCQVGGGQARPEGNRAILGPGTGLGVSGLIRARGGWAAIAGEGGHVTMPSATAEEARLVAKLIGKYEHCSAERLLSGPGLAYIYHAIGGTELTPEQVVQRAREGDANALRAIGMFSEMLGTIAGNLALTLGAQGGVYLAGGILPSIIDLFAASGFRERFEAKARFSAYLQAIPVFVITAQYPAFKGLEAYLDGQAS